MSEGVLRMKALKFGVYVGAPPFWEASTYLVDVDVYSSALGAPHCETLDPPCFVSAPA